MSKGSPIVSVRFTPLDLALMDQAIERCNAKRAGAPFTRSSFIWRCVMDKLAHMERSKRPGRRRPGRRRAAEGQLDQLDQTGSSTPA